MVRMGAQADKALDCDASGYSYIMKDFGFG